MTMDNLAATMSGRVAAGHDRLQRHEQRRPARPSASDAGSRGVSASLLDLLGRVTGGSDCGLDGLGAMNAAPTHARNTVLAIVEVGHRLLEEALATVPGAVKRSSRCVY